MDQNQEASEVAGGERRTEVRITVNEQFVVLHMY